MRTTRVLPVLAGLALSGVVGWFAVNGMRVAASQEGTLPGQGHERAPHGLFEAERWVDFTHVFEWKPESERRE
jgi:hypothetical protein